jgi:hypothetical protein
LTRMMPTFGRKPSRSSMTNLRIRLIGHDFFTLGHAMKAHRRGASLKLGFRERLRAGPMR